MSKSQKPVQDERVTMEENKYRSEALLVIEIVLILSIITKEYILKLPLESSTTDWILLILAAVYPFVRGLFSGGGWSCRAGQSGLICRKLIPSSSWCFGYCFVALAVAMSLAPHWLVMAAMLLALAVVSWVVFSQAPERAIRRHVRMSDFAARCGLQYSPLGKTNTIGTGLLFDVGHSRRYRGVLSYEAGDWRLLEIGRYEYTIGRGKHQQTYTWRYMAVRLPRRVPHMVLDAKQNKASLLNRAIFSNLPAVIEPQIVQ